MASVVYDEGTTNTSSMAGGVGVGGDGPIGGVGGAKGTHTTGIAEKAKPPELKGTGSFLSHPLMFATGFFIVIAVIGNYFVGSGSESFSHSPFLTIFFKVIPFALGVFCMLGWFFTPNITEADQERYKTELGKYKKTKMCMRCGKLFRDQVAAGH